MEVMETIKDFNLLVETSTDNKHPNISQKVGLMSALVKRLRTAAFSVLHFTTKEIFNAQATKPAGG